MSKKLTKNVREGKLTRQINVKRANKNVANVSESPRRRLVLFPLITDNEYTGLCSVEMFHSLVAKILMILPQVVALTFLQFSTEACCDHVTLYDGYDDTSPSIGVLRGSPVGISGTRFSSTQKYLFMKFISDSGGDSSGFVAFYQSVGANSTQQDDGGIRRSRPFWLNSSSVVSSS